MKKLRIMVVGGGGREHALAWKLAQSPMVEKVYCAPGNPGTGLEAKIENLPISASDYAALQAYATEQRLDLTVIGPEQPLVDGLVDRFEAAGLPIFGPTAAAARLEGSKIFAKECMRDAGVPTAAFEIFDAAEPALAYLKTAKFPLVIKADGLAAGKGVSVCADFAAAATAVRQMMQERVFAAAGNRIVIEAFLPGVEVSLIALCSGESYALMLPARDHKSLNEGGKGPNTGGMGAFTPVPDADATLLQRVEQRVFKPMLAHLARRGTPFYGALYAGLMVQGGEPSVLEFNTRFGDPETQPLMWQMQSDLLPMLQTVAAKRKLETPLRWKPGVSVSVVLASAGYPGKVDSGVPIPGLDESNAADDFKVFHAGTKRAGDRIVTAGGRVLALTQRAADIETARRQLYAKLPAYLFAGAVYRKDIAAESRDRS